jgi:hypothetical protein
MIFCSIACLTKNLQNLVHVTDPTITEDMCPMLSHGVKHSPAEDTENSISLITYPPYIFCPGTTNVKKLNANLGVTEVVIVAVVVNCSPT